MNPSSDRELTDTPTKLPAPMARLILLQSGWQQAYEQASSPTKRVQDEEGNWHGFDSEIGREV